MENELPEISITQAEQHDTLVKIIRDNFLSEEDASGGNSAKSQQSGRTYTTDTEDNSSNLESLLNESHLELLQAKFQDDRRKVYLEEFQMLLIDLLQLDVSSDDNTTWNVNSKIRSLFQRIDCYRNGYITWDDVCTYLIYRSKDATFSDKPSPFSGRERIIKFSALKDSIAKVFIDTNSPSKYILVTKDGQINNLSSVLNIRRNTHADVDVTDFKKILNRKRRMKIWVTDCIILTEINKLVVATVNRDLQFFDMATPVYAQIFRLIAFPAAVLSLCYHYKKVIPYNQILLFCGTDSGHVYLFSFHMPSKCLFEMPFKKTNASWKILFMDLPNHHRYVTYRVLPQIHSDWVHRLQFVPDTNMLLSCCNSGKDSLHYRSIDERKSSSYSFKVLKGISCFHFNKEISLLVTGSLDHLLRFWDPYVTVKPMAVLKTHQTSIIDVLIHQPLNLVFSYSKDGNICAFDIKDQICIENFYVKYPLTGNIFDHNSSPLCLSEVNNCILLVAEDCISEMKLSLLKNGEMVSESNGTSVVSVLQIPTRHEVIIAQQSGEITMWNLVNGQHVASVKDKMKAVELTAIAVDNSGEFVVAGYIDGTGTVWSLVTLNIEKELEAYEASEITSIVVTSDPVIFFMVGWSRTIMAYYDVENCCKLRADELWLQSQVNHEDDILCTTFMPLNYLVTGSFDGEVIIWDIEHKRFSKKIQHATYKSVFKEKIISLKLVRKLGNHAMRSGSSSNRISSSKISTLEPVECVLFLSERDPSNFAPLVTAEGNKIKFWSTVATGVPTGNPRGESLITTFCVNEQRDCAITAMVTNEDNSFLVTGDSLGNIFIWNILGYASLRRFSEIVLLATKKTNRLKVSPFASTTKGKPGLITSWVAHEDETIRSLVAFARASQSYIISCGNDAAVTLWNVKGQRIGDFMQKSKWNLDTRTRVSKRKSIPKKDKSDIVNEGKPDSAEDRDRSHGKDALFPSIDVPQISHSAPDLSIISDIEKLKTSDVFKSRKDMNEHVEKMKESWSQLGETYNSEFKRRMLDRHNRRAACNTITEKPLLEYGGINNICSPFNILNTKEIEDFVLPDGLAITPRMVSKSINPYVASSLDNITTLGH